jgi:peroxiredoxin Q/BCP
MTNAFASALFAGAVLAAMPLSAGCSKSEPTKPDAPTATAAPARALAEGDAAPDVTLPLQDGGTTTLAALRGKPVAVYFYPKDDTPGCTVEAQGIRDAWADFEREGVVVLGVSTQDAASHKSFAEKHHLPFKLVVDPRGDVAQAFGVPLTVGLAARQTFLIGKDGRIKKIWRDVNPVGHARELLETAKSG